MLSTSCKATNTPLSLGVLVVPCQESQELVVLVLTVQAKVLLVTCAVRVACHSPSRSGESGTERLTSTRRETLLPQLSLPLPAVLSSWPEATRLMMCPSFLSLLITSTLRRPPPSSRASATSVSLVTSLAFVTTRTTEPAKVK